jgi:MGT family glycosyltransferase
MKRIFCYSLPAMSIHNMFMGVIGGKLAKSGYCFTYYNAQSFLREKKEFVLKNYPDYRDGYNTENISDTISYYGFNEKLLDTALELLPFLMEDIRREKPDFIFHSHLAPWGKFLSRHFSIPAVNFLSTFVMMPEVMAPAFKEKKTGEQDILKNINAGRNVYRKMQSIHQSLRIKEEADIWDICINREELNVAMISKAFQPKPELLCAGKYIFCGMQCSNAALLHSEQRKVLVYVSMGTVFNKDVAIIKTLITALASSNEPCIIAMGKNNNAISHAYGQLPPNVKVEGFADQKELLKQSVCFVTHGGMAGVQEAIRSFTPMIVIPAITEQKIIASKVASLGLGIELDKDTLSVNGFREALRQIRSHHAFYSGNLRALSQKHSGDEMEMAEIINNYLMGNKI